MVLNHIICEKDLMLNALHKDVAKHKGEGETCTCFFDMTLMTCYVHTQNITTLKYIVYLFTVMQLKRLQSTLNLGYFENRNNFYK